MDAHNAWIAKGLADEVFLCVGSLDVGGGFILANGEENKALVQRVMKDPFVENNVVTAEVHQVHVKLTAPELAHLAKER